MGQRNKEYLALVVPVVFLVLPVTVLFTLYPIGGSRCVRLWAVKSLLLPIGHDEDRGEHRSGSRESRRRGGCAQTCL
jgi:hypothetical protein